MPSCFPWEEWLKDREYTITQKPLFLNDKYAGYVEYNSNIPNIEPQKSGTGYIMRNDILQYNSISHDDIHIDHWIDKYRSRLVYFYEPFKVAYMVINKIINNPPYSSEEAIECVLSYLDYSEIKIQEKYLEQCGEG